MSFEIPITQHLNSFHQHLEINSRTIFSAKFGDGKSFFLNEFKEKYKNDYYFITLYPVNYSVAENADIFEYIKRDIIIQLAKDDILCNIDFETLADSIFNIESLMEVVSYLVSFMPHGVFIKKIIDKTKIIFDKYQKDKETYKDFLVSFTLQKGGLYECDTYTKMIEQALMYIKEKQEKKTILIIEDLDRIDPAHLFRILNVLGAHIDTCNQDNYKTNKFGFNNIATVFDYEITSHLFHHFYGNKANYSGYINKFITHYPFYYSINQIAIDFLFKFINENCQISKNSLSKINIPIIEKTLTEIINELSVRDIRQILYNLDDQIICKTETISPSISFYTLNSATKFYAIFKRMNINLIHLNNCIVNKFDNISEKLNLTSSFMIYDKYIQEYSNITLSNNKYFNIKRRLDSMNIITDLKFIRGSSGIYIEGHNFLHSISSGLDEALKYVKP